MGDGVYDLLNAAEWCVEKKENKFPLFNSGLLWLWFMGQIAFSLSGGTGRTEVVGGDFGSTNRQAPFCWMMRRGLGCSKQRCSSGSRQPQAM